MDAALFNYLQLAKVTHKKGWGYSELGHFYRERGLLDEALEAYQRAANEENSDPLHLTYLAQTYYNTGQQDEALQTFAEAIEANQDDGNYFVYATYGFILQQSLEFSQAAEMYEKSLELRPEDYPVLMNLGVTYEALGDLSKAAKAYEKIIDLEASFSEDQVQAARQKLEAIKSSDQ